MTEMIKKTHIKVKKNMKIDNKKRMKSIEYDAKFLKLPLLVYISIYIHICIVIAFCGKKYTKIIRMCKENNKTKS